MASETYICVLNAHSHEGDFPGRWVACRFMVIKSQGLWVTLPKVTQLKEDSHVRQKDIWCHRPGNLSLYAARTWQMWLGKDLKICRLSSIVLASWVQSPRAPRRKEEAEGQRQRWACQRDSDSHGWLCRCWKMTPVKGGYPGESGHWVLFEGRAAGSGRQAAVWLCSPVVSDPGERKLGFPHFSVAFCLL